MAAPRAAALLLFLGGGAGHRVGALLEEAAEEAVHPGRAALPTLLAASAAAAFAPGPARTPARTMARTQPLFWKRAWGTLGLGDDGEGHLLFFPPPVGHFQGELELAVSGEPGVGGSDVRARSPEGVPGNGMVMVDAIPLLRSDEPKAIPLPADWARKFHGGAVAYFEAKSLPGVDMLVRGRLAESPGEEEVSIERWRAAQPATARHFRINDMLADLPFVPRTFERRDIEGWTFALVEPPTHHTLGGLIETHMAKRESEWEPVVPLAKTLPLMLDILAAFKELNARGVVVPELHRSTVTLSGDGSHMLLGDFRYAGLEHSADPEVSCAAAAEQFTTSPLRLAPEVVGATADRVSNNQWQLGLVLSMLLLGVDPVEDLVGRLLGDVDAYSEDGRVMVAVAVRRYLHVWALPGFAELAVGHADVLRILSGLLEKDPNLRLTAEEAWNEVADVAKARGIPIDGGRRVPQPLPRAWHGE